MIGAWLLARFARAARRQGNHARDRHAWSEAAGHYRRYLTFAPDDFAIRVQLGHVLGEAGDLDAAEDAYRDAARLSPRDADLLLCWGHLRKRRGDAAGARALYEQSAAVDGNGHAIEAVASLGEPEPEPVPEPEPEPAPLVAPEPVAPEPAPPVYAGRVHGAHDRMLFCVVMAPDGPDATSVEFRADGRIVGHARLDEAYREGDGYAAKTVVDVADAASVSAYRLPDGAELDNSPLHVSRHAHHDAPPLAWLVPLAVVKPFAMPADGEVALFITHTRTGTLKPHVLPYLAALHAQGIAVLLIAVTDRPLVLGRAVLDVVAGAVARANVGYDFAAWAHAIRLHPEVYGAATLYLLNDSVVGPAGGGRFERLIARVRASDADLVGLTESQEYRWHLQSYFLALKPRLLSSFRLQRFFDDIRLLPGKDDVIRAYELRFAADAAESGHRVEILFPSPYARNPTLYGWRELIAAGFPFLKLLLLRGAFPEVDSDGWRGVAEVSGFDVAAIDATLAASDEQDIPYDHDDRLLAAPTPHGGDAAGPLKVAFYGPWNYDNGLGAAARGIIGAIRRTGVRLNLHPIEKPFHIHRPLAPPVDVIDFNGAPDIAIVHLNPDSWHLLTDAQRAAIGQARKRIGYWVWEMGHLPPGWRADFSSVDRIWAPSRYCEELFAAQDEAPVDIVPHAVPLPRTPAFDAAALRASIGVPAGGRILLYVFDGSSYLIRKNPAALIRALAQSGLADRGWWLVLKTKHLMDRAREGAALRTLAEATRNVLLIDRTMPADTLSALLHLADVYASPHASEGFGLTIAEAMAAGKPVVATDFGGSADFLDATSGYPVTAHAHRLTEDHGHYTQGGEWAQVDEDALADALTRAAAAVAAGDHAIGDAARARIAAQLSLDAVGTRIAESFAATMTGRGARPAVERIFPRLLAGVPFADADLGPRISAAPLAPDGAPFGPAIDVAPDREQWVAFAPEGSVVTPLFARILAEHAQARPDVAIFYGDDVAVLADNAVDQVRLKPDFDVTLLAAQDYVGAPLIVRADALRALGGLRADMRTAATADLLFRAHAAGLSIARIPEVLLAHRGERVRATAADYRTMLTAQPALRGYDVRDGQTRSSFALARRFDDAAALPPVTLIVPTRRSARRDGQGTYIAQLLEGVAQADWPMDRLTVLVGDDIVGTPDWEQADWPFALRRIETPRAPGERFNYAAKMNRLWRAAETEQIVFVNDDVRPLDGGWLKALQTFALDEGVGGVGARLRFEDGSLQHAGLVPHGLCAAHVWIHRRRVEGTYQDWAMVHREWSMVTGAVFATRRSVMDQVNGFDEAFALEFNDTDLCLRLRALGYRIVCTPHAELVHTEKASRGEALPRGDEVARFVSRWRPWLDNDPSWHPLLRRDRLDMVPQPDHHAWYH